MIRRPALQEKRNESNTSGVRRSRAQRASLLHPELAAHGSISAWAFGCSLALGAAFLACGAGEEADGQPDFGNLPAFGQPNGAGSNGNGSASSGNANNSGTSNNGNNSGAVNGSQSGNTGNNSGNTPSAPSPGNNSPAPSTPPSNVTEGNPSNAPINNGMNNGNAMPGAMAGGAGGANGGTGMPPAPNPNQPPPPVNNNPPPVTPPPVTPPPVTPPPVTPQPPAAPDIACPAGATFCSGFEGAGLPAGTTFEPSYLAAGALGTEVVLDATVAHSGRQSLKMPVGHNYYRMLSVATPASYWVRLFARSTVGLGAKGSTHATFFMGSTVAPGGDYNADKPIQIAEQFDQVLLNVQDVTFGTGGVSPNGKAGTRLPDNAWSCMEAQFDGPTGDVHVYVEGTEIINASGWQPPTALKSFRFGYMRFVSPDRDVWMDDVVVSTSRIRCN